ncbi:MAG: SHOCT domain-containing protein [Verrucomicrobia bacterium]|nr:SHOCT domain-containing protein [Verrucomicrobiota bacterium]
MKKLSLALSLLSLTVVISGCTHPMAVKNLDNYHNKTIVALDERLRIGIRANAADLNGHRFIHAVGRDMLKYNAQCTTAVDETNNFIDVIANISVVSKQRGSGWNFWADFPGFLIWFPSWHGYNYHVMYDIDVTLNDAKTGKLINSMYIPVRLDVKHADIDRTWVMWSVPVISPFFGGLHNMTYDETITPLVEQEVSPVLADYVAQQIALTLHYYKSLPRDRFEKLQQLLNDKLISKEEFEMKRKAIVDDI